MTAMAAGQRMTAQEFLALPEGETSRWLELLDGELVMFDPDMLHNVVQGNLLYPLYSWARAAPGRGRVCIPLDVLIDERNVFEPDISWYREERKPDAHAPRPYPVPDLAVEIRSPSTWARDVGTKKSGYERHGLPELWLVDTTAAQVLAFRRSTPAATRFDVALELGRGERLESPLLPGFVVQLEDVFELT
jgi:Uma2 family endonuclease